MSAVTWAQTVSGRAVDLVDPQLKDIDPLYDLPENLARVGRFNGGVPGGIYSVAQHCVIGCDAILDETGDGMLATYFLLHDAHEYLSGDWTAPQQAAMAEFVRQVLKQHGVSHPSAFENAMMLWKLRLDKVVFASCGVPWPMPEEFHRQVKIYDIRVLATERNQLLAPSVKSWPKVIENAPPIRMRGRLQIWPVWKAAEEYRKRLLDLCPSLKRRAEA